MSLMAEVFKLSVHQKIQKLNQSLKKYLTNYKLKIKYRLMITKNLIYVLII